ncbi:carbon-nitrogen hydrolase family protein [Legionella gresilensis]|uniref:carbon-nitrogen hydrolase family protein n=1 Tax=Legionella gresilensis TaxID=91823 RepID=UPI0010413E33|nr:carbon-nitrogen hydrolase family protein [Legionella gresilensis]
MVKVAAIQMTSSSSITANISIVEKYLQEVANQDISLVVLPENFAFMGTKEVDKLAIAEEFGNGLMQDSISRLAKEYNLWLIAGTIPIKTNGTRIRSACLVFDNKGLCQARYDKIHLFDVEVANREAYLESATVEPGDKVVVVDTPIGRVGLSVCYDVRFPELYRQLESKGAQLFVVPSAFTAITGLAHWEILLRARAIENLCYVLAPNQGGKHENGRETYGHSMIIDPWGKILAEKINNSGIVSASIDLAQLEILRQRFPCNRHHIL